MLALGSVPGLLLMLALMSVLTAIKKKNKNEVRL